MIRTCLASRLARGRVGIRGKAGARVAIAAIALLGCLIAEGAPPAPLPDAGATSTFSWQRAAADSPAGASMFIIKPVAPSAKPYLVPEAFLASTVGRANYNDSLRATTLGTWPDTARRAYEALMNRAFPAAASPPVARGATPTPAPEVAVFADQLLGPEGSAQARISQDPMAQPYVRVELVDPKGQALEQPFSVSKGTLNEILTSPRNPSEGLRLKALLSTPLRLPEAARVAYAGLSREQIRQFAEADPAIAGLDVVKQWALQRQAGTIDRVNSSPAGSATTSTGERATSVNPGEAASERVAALARGAAPPGEGLAPTTTTVPIAAATSTPATASRPGEPSPHAPKLTGKATTATRQASAPNAEERHDLRPRQVANASRLALGLLLLVVFAVAGMLLIRRARS